MRIQTKYGPVEVNVGDTLQDGDRNWTVVQISDPRDCVEAMHQSTVPVILVHDPKQPNLCHTEQHQVITKLGLACHLLEELNVRSFVVGQYAVFNGETFATKLKEKPTPKEYYHYENGISVNTYLDNDLMKQGMAREIVRCIQNARKKEKLDMMDRIMLAWDTKSELVEETLLELHSFIYRETLATLALTKEVSDWLGDFQEFKLNDGKNEKHDFKIKFKKI